MANPTTDLYTGSVTSNGSGITLDVVGGRFVDAQAQATAGTVSMLASNWSGTGFQTLTTIPDGLLLVNTPGHTGAAWDESRQKLWLFGSETHGPAQTDNAVYYWDANTGLAGRMYSPDPRTGDYHIRVADGISFANAAESRPWGMHTFSNLSYDSTTKEVCVSADSYDHSYATSWTPPPANVGATRKNPLWFYNTVSGTWRYQLTEAINTFSTPELGSSSVRVSGQGWWRVGGNSLTNLSENGATVTNYSIYGKLDYTRIQSISHVVGTKLIGIGGTGDWPANGKGPYLGFICHLDNPTNGAHRNLTIAEFPALTGWNADNTWSVKMPDGRILFGAWRASPQQVGAFVFDWNNGTPTVTDTGYRLAATNSSAANTYDLRVGWSTKYNCAFISSLRHGGHKIIGLRI